MSTAHTDEALVRQIDTHTWVGVLGSQGRLILHTDKTDNEPRVSGKNICLKGVTEGVHIWHGNDKEIHAGANQLTCLYIIYKYIMLSNCLSYYIYLQKIANLIGSPGLVPLGHCPQDIQGGGQEEGYMLEIHILSSNFLMSYCNNQAQW